MKQKINLLYVANLNIIKNDNLNKPKKKTFDTKIFAAKCLCMIFA